MVVLKQRDLVPPTQPLIHLKNTPHILYTALQVKPQPEDGPNIGPKHVVVFLLYY